MPSPASINWSLGSRSSDMFRLGLLMIMLSLGFAKRPLGIIVIFPLLLIALHSLPCRAIEDECLKIILVVFSC